MNNILDKLFFVIDSTLPLIVIIVMGIYIYLCTITNYTIDNTKLTQNDKIISLTTTIFGILLNSLLLLFHIGYISEFYSDNISIQFVELFLIFLIIFLAYYCNIFRENENDTLSKIASGLWPLLSSLGIIMILSLIAIYNYFNKISSSNALPHVLIPVVKI